MLTNWRSLVGMIYWNWYDVKLIKNIMKNLKQLKTAIAVTFGRIQWFYFLGYWHKIFKTFFGNINIKNS